MSESFAQSGWAADAAAVTLGSYNAALEAYRTGTPSVVDESLALWLSAAVEGLACTAAILELGSGLGRDAAWLEGRGFVVERTDGAQVFVDFLRASGFRASLLDLTCDDLGVGRDLVLANAVLLHLPQEQFASALARIRSCLAPGGRLALSLKSGSGSFFSNEKLALPRFFQLYSLQEAAAALDCAGFSRVERVGSPAGPWLHLVAWI